MILGAVNLGNTDEGKRQNSYVAHVLRVALSIRNYAMYILSTFCGLVMLVIGF